MIPRFGLARPATLQEALDVVTGASGDAAYFAGGTELLQVMKMGLAQVGTLVDLKAIPDLRGVDVAAGGWLRIGATTTHREVERSPVVRSALPALADLELHLANARVRNTGTLGGNLAFAEPHSDPATLLLACDAEVELTGPGGSRRLAIGDFVLGPLFTAREAEEILVAVHVPPRAVGEGRGYAKIKFFERPAASVAVRLSVADGRVAAATVAAGSLTDTPVLVPNAAASLVGAAVTGAELAAAVERAGEAMAELDAVGDHSGSADYKRYLAGVLLGRAARSAREEALHA